GMCAVVLMTADNSGSVADLTQYSFGTVLNGTVTANVSGGLTNNADSTPNLDSTSNNGTAGHTTGPDLEGVTLGAPAGTNEIIYTFDQNVDCANLNPDWFGYYNAGTVDFNATITGCSGPNVRVAFDVPTVSDAVIAFVSRDDANCNAAGCEAGPNQPPPDQAAMSDTPNPETQTPTESVTVSGTSGITARPDLVSAALSGSNQIDYTFDQTVALGTAGGECTGIPFGAPEFVAVTSNGDEISATSATVLADGKTVRATFSGPDIANYLEEVTVASTYVCAVKSANGIANTQQGKPVGDNAGANASGYTNGPDAISTAFDSSSGQVTVNFDQRVAANAAGQPVGNNGNQTNLGNWILLDNQGNPLATPTSATVISTGPFTSAVRLTFPNPATVGVAKSIELCGNQYPSSITPTSNPYIEWQGATSDTNCADTG